MATQGKGFPVVDVDSHILEPGEIWTEYLEPEYRAPARSSFLYEVDENGLAAVVLNGQPAEPMGTSKLNRLALYKPGMTPQEVGAMDPRKAHPATPGARDSQERLKDMDAMGIDQALIMPTLFAEYFPVIENPDIAYAMARAYNNWVHDFAKAAPDRLFPAAVLPLQGLAFAVREARRVAGMGFKAVFIRPAVNQNRFPTEPYYQPLWAALNELGLAVCVHPSPGSTNPEWTSEGPFVERVAANLRIGHPIAEAVAPWMDNGLFLGAVCFLGQMEDYPDLKISYLHSGAFWVTLVLEKSETYLWLSPQMHKPVSLEPAEVFFNRPSLVSFDTWESSVARMPDIYGRVAAWGSRYPQHDASDAAEAIQGLQEKGVSGDVIQDLMGGNAARFYGIEARVAAQPSA